jgi:predicted DNA-binding ribbon-helix-helix protein
MSGDPRLAALAALAGTLRDARLAALQAAELRRRAAAAAVARLPAGATVEGENIASALRAASQSRWLALERGRQGAALASSSAAALEARESAARALARAEALRRLARLPR